MSQESHSIEIVAQVVTLEGLVLEELCVITFPPMVINGLFLLLEEVICTLDP